MFKYLLIFLFICNQAFAQTYEVSTGNLGINTASPTATLGVGGNAEIGSASYTNAASPPSNGLIVQGNVGLGSLTPGQALDVQGTIRGLDFSGIQAADIPTLNQNTTGNAATSTTAPSTALLATGTVTGATSQAQIFTAPTTGRASINLAASSAVNPSSPNSGDLWWNGTNLYFYNGAINQDLLGNNSGWTTSGINVYETGSGNVGIGTTYVNAGAALSVMNGNVGIGTWGPYALFQVATSSGNPIIEFSRTGGYSSVSESISTTSGGSGDNGLIYTASAYEWRNTSNSPFVTLRTSGNLGVGTFNPGSRLSVNGGVSIGTSLTNGAYTMSNSAPSGGLIVQNNVGIGTFNPFGGQLIVPTTNGNVGIGSLTPGQPLDVTGDIRGSDWSAASTGDILCKKANGSIGYCVTSITGVICATCT